MADGRFLSKTVAHDIELASVSVYADCLFLRCIPHLDREGRMPGHPKQVRALACPMRDDMTDEVVERALIELAAVGLVVWYEVDGRKYLHFPGFKKNQKGLREDREAPSTIPGPDSPGAVRLPNGNGSDQSGAAPDDSGVTPEHSGSNPEDAGSAPGELPLKLREVKGREVKGSTVSSLRSETGPAARRSFPQNVEKSDGPPFVDEPPPATPEDVRRVVGRIMPLIRHYFYVPDGKPPPRYSDDQDANITQTLLEHGVEPADISAFIVGLAWLRDHGGLEYFGPGDKLTMAVGYKRGKSVVPVWRQAIEAFNRHVLPELHRRQRNGPGNIRIRIEAPPGRAPP